MLNNNFIRFWVGKNLPRVYYSKELRNLNNGEKLSYINRTYFLHPIKRRLSKYYLSILRRFFDLKVIGITGSAGKTTTKEMLASILKREGTTVYSYANIDPIYNIPSTILMCRPSTKFLILEMGVEYPGEMDFYLWLAKPDIGVITNIARTHTEYFGDISGVFREKRKLVDHINPGGFAVLNGEDKLLRGLVNRLNVRVFQFGNGSGVMSSRVKISKDIGTKFLLIIDQNKSKRIWITIPTVGQQFVYDALAASGVAWSLGISLKVIKKGLESFSPAEHRMNIIKHRSGAVILDDSYNNNPKAAIEAIKTLCTIANGKEKIVVFGDMLELGKVSRKYHEKIGRELGKSGLSRLICVGRSVKYTAEAASKIMGEYHIDIVEKVDEVFVLLKPYLKKGVYILIKGSRSLNLDKLVNQLSDRR